MEDINGYKQCHFFRSTGSERLTKDLALFGLALRDLYPNAVTPPAEVQQAIDDRSRLGILGKA
nr:hypothetical protein [Deltaproteobacteria bacterium]